MLDSDWSTSIILISDWLVAGRYCRKKVVRDDTDPRLYNCKCGDKKLPESETELRYMLDMSIMDATSNTWVTMFDAQTLFNMTAQELNNIKEKRELEFLEVINKTRFQQMLMSVSAKVETYNGSPKLKMIVNTVRKIWTDQDENAGRNYIKRRWAEIVQIEREMDISHEEEVGVAVNGLAAFEDQH